MKKTCVFLLVGFLAVVSGCSTIWGSHMSYLGNDNAERNVIGVASHTDWMGLGINGDQYASEYEKAASNALRRGPAGTVALENIKVFKEYKFNNQILGSILYSLGVAMIVSYEDELILPGAGLSLVGLILTGLNQYDLILIADPVIK